MAGHEAVNRTWSMSCGLNTVLQIHVSVQEMVAIGKLEFRNLQSTQQSYPAAKRSVQYNVPTEVAAIVR